MNAPARNVVPNNLEAFWMPFTANRQFKSNPRLFVAAKDMHYTTADGRSRGQVMADTLVERITGRPAEAATPIAVELVVPDETLFGGAFDPGLLERFAALRDGSVEPLLWANRSGPTSS